MPTAVRLPGVYFQTEVPQPSDRLPRMDIAAFVGFATGGPMDLPVPVEDADRFREIFGDDPQLAWDPETGRTVGGYLGAAVEAFFRNGGRRCWVVRVGGAAWTHRFEIPGLVGAADGAAVTAPARSPGSWAAGLAIGSVLVRSTLTLDRGDGEPPFAPAREPPPVVRELYRDGFRLDVAGAPAALAPGELLEVAFDGGLTAYLFLDRVVSTRRGRRLWGESLFWFARGEDDSLSRLDAGAGAAAWDEWLASGPAPGLSARRLGFELLAFRGQELAARVGELAFSSVHPRFWGNLPSDDSLFALPHGRRHVPPAAEVQELLDEAASPRFPLAGPTFTSPGPHLFLPLGMGVTPRAEDAAPPLAGAPAVVAEQDGLATFSAGLFLDPRLAPVASGALLGEAENRYYQLQQPLSGLHALLPVGEASLVAVPDACHRAWSLDPPPVAEPLAAPELDAIPPSDDLGLYRVTWSAVDGATGYLLERDLSPDFPSPVAVYRGLDREARLALPASCPTLLHLRVRARRYGEVGAWSRGRSRRLPPGDFDPCTPPPPSELLLSSEPGSPDGLLLTWSPLAGASPPEEVYELQEADEADFLAPVVLLYGAERAVALADRLDTTAYYRARAWRAGEPGSWSNTVRLAPAGRSALALGASTDYDGRDLLAVHRALLRFCAARADLVALLGLPRHYRRAETLAHLDALVPSAEAIAPGSGGEAAGVPPLGAGEEVVLDFGALHHPWLAVSALAGGDRRRAGDGVRFTPPDGTLAGSMALVARRRGAWVAAANLALEGVVALDPELGRDDLPDLYAAQLNLVRRDPRGFLLLGADTLSRETERRPLNVRRLLILLRRFALREGDADVFEPNDADFRSFARHRFERLLSDLYVRGAFAGPTPESSYRVVADESLNTRQSIEAGRFIVELRVAPSRPLVFLTVRLLQAGPENLVVEEA